MIKQRLRAMDNVKLDMHGEGCIYIDQKTLKIFSEGGSGRRKIRIRQLRKLCQCAENGLSPKEASRRTGIYLGVIPTAMKYWTGESYAGWKSLWRE